MQNMVLRTCVGILTAGFIPGMAWGQPTLTVSDAGLNGSNNREWLIQVSPDATLFTSGMGSVNVELAFEVTDTDLVGATVNGPLWPFANPGNNPFTGGSTLGLQTDFSGDTVFASFGSDLFSTGDPVEVLTIETLGSASATLSWGGHTLLPGTPNEYVGSRISQAGMNFDGNMGSLVAGSTCANPISGDLDCSGLTGASDLDLVLSNWGLPATPVPAGWVNDLPSGIIGADELDNVLGNWGNTASPAVPEPAFAGVMLLSMALVVRRRLGR